MNLRRILMNAADASPGSGSESTSAAPSEPQASGAPAAPAIDIAAIVAEASAKAAEQARNAVFADLRRTGQLKEAKPSKATEPPASKDAAPAQPDLTRLRQLDRALAKTPHMARLSDSQHARLERAFAEESPPDVSAWLADYFGDLGTAAAPAVPVATAAAVTTPNSAAASAPRTGPPASDGGAPAQSQVPLEERRIVGMSPSDIKHLIDTKGLAYYKAKVFAELRGTSVSVKK